MKKIFVGLAILGSVSAFSAPNIKGESICRSGALSKWANADFAKEACADVKSESEGICRSGALSKWANADFAKEACADL